MLFFLHAFIFGVTVPVISLYLTRTRGFSGLEAGTILGVAGIATLLSPLVTIVLADRSVSSERLFAGCKALAALFLGIFSYATGFAWILALYLLYKVFLTPTSGLINVLIVHHEEDVERNFGFIRMWGSLGWIAAGWVFSFVWLQGERGWVALDRLPDAFRLAAWTAVAAGALALTFKPKWRARERSVSLLAPEVRSGVLRKDLMVLTTLSLAFSALNEAYFFGMGPCLEQAGYAEAKIMPWMSLGQATEVVTMLGLGRLLSRWRIKTVLGLGAALNVIRFAALAAGRHPGFITTGVVLSGASFTLFTIVVFIYFDRHTAVRVKSATQQVIVLAADGVGPFVGNFLAGLGFDRWRDAARGVDFDRFWLVAALLALGLCGALWIGFFEGEGRREGVSLKGPSR